jgi:zinc protease
VLRTYLAPGEATAAKGEAEALEVLIRILAQGETSRLHRRLVATDASAIVVEGGYAAGMRDSGQIAIFAVMAPGGSVDRIETALDAEIARLLESGVGDDELQRAKSVIEARDVFDGDNQLTRARRTAEAIANGLTLADLAARGGRLAAVTAQDIVGVARKVLARERSVTGVLRPADAGAARASAGKT